MTRRCATLLLYTARIQLKILLTIPYTILSTEAECAHRPILHCVFICKRLRYIIIVHYRGIFFERWNISERVHFWLYTCTVNSWLSAIFRSSAKSCIVHLYINVDGKIVVFYVGWYMYYVIIWFELVKSKTKNWINFYQSAYRLNRYNKMIKY